MVRAALPSVPGAIAYIFTCARSQTSVFLLQQKIVDSPISHQTVDMAHYIKIPYKPTKSDQTSSNSDKYTNSELREDVVLNNLRAVAKILKIFSESQEDGKAVKQRYVTEKVESEDHSGTYVITEEHTPLEEYLRSDEFSNKTSIGTFETPCTSFPFIAEFLNTIQRKYEQFSDSAKRPFEAFWIDLKDLSKSGEIEIKQQFDLAYSMQSQFQDYRLNKATQCDGKLISDSILSESISSNDEQRLKLIKRCAENVIDEILNEASFLAATLRNAVNKSYILNDGRKNIDEKTLINDRVCGKKSFLDFPMQSALRVNCGLHSHEKSYSFPTTPYKCCIRRNVAESVDTVNVRSLEASVSGNITQAESEVPTAATGGGEGKEAFRAPPTAHSEPTPAHSAACTRRAQSLAPSTPRGPRNMRNIDEFVGASNCHLAQRDIAQGPDPTTVIESVQCLEGEKKLPEVTMDNFCSDVKKYANGSKSFDFFKSDEFNAIEPVKVSEVNDSAYVPSGITRRNKMNGDNISNGLPDLIDEKESSKIIDRESSRENISVKRTPEKLFVEFEKVVGGEKLREVSATARRLVGKWRDARRRSIRRATPRARAAPSLRPARPSCVLLRVVPAGPCLLLEVSTPDSTNTQTFENKLFSLHDFCICTHRTAHASCGSPDVCFERINQQSKFQKLAHISADESVPKNESEIYSRVPYHEEKFHESKSLLNLNFDQLKKVKEVSGGFDSIPSLDYKQVDSKVSSVAEPGKVPESYKHLKDFCESNQTEYYIPVKNESLSDETLKVADKNCVCSCHSDKSVLDSSANLSSPCPTDNNLSIVKEPFLQSPETISANNSERSEFSDFLSSKVLNSFEISSRLKRLEEKLKNSVESNYLNSPVEDSSYFEEHTFQTDTHHFFNKETNNFKNNNYLDSFGKINRDLNISEYCTESLDSDNAVECPTKKLFRDGKNCFEEENCELTGSSDKLEVETDLCSDDETGELEEFERQERWASNEEYFAANADLFAGSSCQFTASDISQLELGSAASEERLKCYDELWDSSESVSSVDEETAANTHANGNMRGEQPARPDRRHNKDANNLKSLLKKVSRKGKKNRVIFNENKNEFFEADYIILIREECQYDEESDEGVCTCSQHEMVRLCCSQEEGEPTLSPPEGYKDPGLFRPDGSLREQGLLAGPGGLLVAEAGGPVFSPQHLRQLQLIQRLQQEQLRRARQALQDEVEPPPEEEKEEVVEPVEAVEEEDRLSSRSYAKEIVAGEERPKVNSGQQTTPTDEIQRYVVETVSLTTETERRIITETPVTEEDDPSEGRQSDVPGEQHNSPMRLGGILKGGRLWKASMDMPPPDQTEESTSFSNSASDEEGRGGRAVRFSEPSAGQSDSLSQLSSVDEPSESQDQVDASSKPQELTLTFKLGNHLLSNNSLRPNSAVRQLFPAGPGFVTPPQRSDADKQYLVTAESLRAFEEGKRSKLPTSYRDEDLTVRRTIDRNTLRRSLVKVEPRKKPMQKNDTSLTERIKMLTCNIEDEEGQEQEPKSTNIDRSISTEETHPHPPSTLPSKCFSPSSSSSSASSCSSTSSAYKKLTDIFPKRQQDRIPECNEEGNGNGVVIIPQADKPMSLGNSRPGDRLSQGSASTDYSSGDIDGVLDQPTPDVLAGTPGAGEGDELARFVQQEAARTERLRKRYTQQASVDNSDEDDQDDYGFQRRPSVRGIKPRFGSTNEILQQMQSQLMAQAQTRPGHISWPYYSESNLSLPVPHDHNMLHHQQDNRPMEEFQQPMQQRRERERADQGRDMHPPQHHHITSIDPHHENIYQNCVTYANARCNSATGERDLYAASMQAYSRAHRRPESPPPIRSYHQTMVLIPYSNLQPHYPPSERNYHMGHPVQGEQNGAHPDYQHQLPKELPPHLKQQHNHNAPQQMVNMPYQQTGIPMQITCSAPIAHLRTVPARPVARHMICYSEKVQAPLYQSAPGSAEVAGDSANIPIYF